MSDEIKQEPVDNQPAKELSTDELGEVTGGGILSHLIDVATKSKGDEPTEPPQGGQNDPAQMFQQILQQLTQGQG